MERRALSNVEKLTIVARRLDHLLDSVVFVGGTVVELLVTDPAATDIRPTVDVDTVTKISSRAEYYALEEDMRALGFRQKPGDGEPVCRWHIDSIAVDLMPDIPEIIGFSNIWYEEAIQNSNVVKLSEDTSVRVISAPYFLATKIEAFKGRGGNDYLASADIEDIVTLIDGRVELLEEIQASSPELREYLSRNLKALASTQDFLSSIPGHLAPDAASQDRLPLVIDRINHIIDM